MKQVTGCNQSCPSRRKCNTQTKSDSYSVWVATHDCGPFIEDHLEELQEKPLSIHSRGRFEKRSHAAITISTKHENDDDDIRNDNNNNNKSLA